MVIKSVFQDMTSDGESIRTFSINAEGEEGTSCDFNDVIKLLREAGAVYPSSPAFHLDVHYCTKTVQTEEGARRTEHYYISGAHEDTLRAIYDIITKGNPDDTVYHTYLPVALRYAFDAINDAVEQFEQMEKMFRDDAEFQSARNALIDAGTTALSALRQYAAKGVI